MYKTTIKYVDYDGTEREEEFCFNISRAELATMELSMDGGMAQYLNTIIAKKDSAKLMDAFTDILRKSYGVKSPDGKRFIKSPELSAEFMQTEAYSELFMKLVTDADAAAAFVNGIMPTFDTPSYPAPMPSAHK